MFEKITKEMQSFQYDTEDRVLKVLMKNLRTAVGEKQTAMGEYASTRQELEIDINAVIMEKEEERQRTHIIQTQPDQGLKPTIRPIRRASNSMGGPRGSRKPDKRKNSQSSVSSDDFDIASERGDPEHPANTLTLQFAKNNFTIDHISGGGTMVGKRTYK